MIHFFPQVRLAKQYQRNTLYRRGAYTEVERIRAAANKVQDKNFPKKLLLKSVSLNHHFINQSSQDIY